MHEAHAATAKTNVPTAIAKIISRYRNDVRAKVADDVAQDGTSVKPPNG
jgi:hypothetical protein